MPETPEDGDEPPLFESATQYGVRKASERAWGMLEQADPGPDVELAAVFYREALFHAREAGDALPDLTALRERGLRIARETGSDAAEHLFGTTEWEAGPEPAGT